MSFLDLFFFFRKQLNITTQSVSNFFTYLHFVYKDTHTSTYLSVCMSVRPSIHPSSWLAGWLSG